MHHARFMQQHNIVLCLSVVLKEVERGFGEKSCMPLRCSLPLSPQSQSQDHHQHSHVFSVSIVSA